MKKLLYAFLITAIAAVHSGCKDDEGQFIHVEKVSIDVTPAIKAKLGIK